MNKYGMIIISISLFLSNPVVADSTSIAAHSVKQDSMIESAAHRLQENEPVASWRLSYGKIVWTVILLSVSFFIIRTIARLLELLADRWPNWRLTLKGVIPVLRVFGWTFIIYIIIAIIIRPPIQTLVAVTASAGIAVGFASQDILKNIFGGILILFDRPFQVGDKIEVSSYYGEVIDIGFRTVRIVTPDDSVVSVPNSEMVNQSVSNSNSGQSNCQVVAELYLPPDIDISQVKKLAYRSAAVSKYVYLNKPISIIFKNEIHEGRSLLKLRLKAYVLDIRYEFAFMSEMTEILMQELLKRHLVSPDDLLFTPQNIRER